MTPPPCHPNLVQEPRGRPGGPPPPSPATGPPPAPTPQEWWRGGSARQVRTRHRAGRAHAPSPRGGPHSAPWPQAKPVRTVSYWPPEIGFLPQTHDSLAPESRQPPEFRPPSPPPRNEIRGSVASELRTSSRSPASSRGASSLSWPAFAAPVLPAAAAAPAAASLERTLPTCHREPPGLRSMPSPLPDPAWLPARRESGYSRRPGGGAGGRCPGAEGGGPGAWGGGPGAGGGGPSPGPGKPGRLCTKGPLSLGPFYFRYLEARKVIVFTNKEQCPFAHF